MQRRSRVTSVQTLRYQARRYLTKHALTDALVKDPVARQLQVVAAVPCYDEPTVTPLLESLWAAAPPRGKLEVLCLVNASVADGAAVHQRNRRLVREVVAFDARHGDGQRRVYALHQPALPVRHAGVGLARKLAMDEALRRLARNGPGGGLICCLDADCRVDPDYWQALAGQLNPAPGWSGGSLYFEHDDAESAATPIGRYELYLRYYRNALRMIGHPHGFHTVGSAMAVASHAYAAVGGMNRRQAGEDFYFAKKLMLFGGFSDLCGTTVRPGNRISQRVPFGTGQALQLQQTRNTLLVPGPADFLLLAPLFEHVLAGREPAAIVAVVDPRLAEFLLARGLAARLAEIGANTTSPAAFAQRFFAWFDGLKVRQWLNHCRAAGSSMTDVNDAAAWLAARLGDRRIADDPMNLAGWFRRLDRAGGAPAARFRG
jgi:hypothetical protein